MVEVDWYDIADTDFHTDKLKEGAAIGGTDIMPADRIGIMICEEDRFEDFLDSLCRKIGGVSGMEMLYVDFKGSSSSEDYQERIVEGIDRFLKGESVGTESVRYWTEAEKKARSSTLDFLKDNLGHDIEGETLADKATKALVILSEIGDHLKKKFITIMDLRDIKLDPSVFRPGQKFWWVYNLATKADSSMRVWLIDCDEDIFDTLSEHGQMEKLFGEDGTDLYMII